MQQDVKEILQAFFDQVETGSHVTSHYPSYYLNLRLDVGFGIGKDANIPWIAFLGEQQTVQNGIFPVFYFFKAHHRLILAYGISETIKPKRNWFVPPNTKTIKQYFDGLHINPRKYHYSYFYETYTTFKDLDFEKIEADLDRLISRYKKIMQLNSQ
jgi:5-methylcytosine-specific restriction enzyme B